MKKATLIIALSSALVMTACGVDIQDGEDKVTIGASGVNIESGNDKVTVGTDGIKVKNENIKDTEVVNESNEPVVDEKEDVSIETDKKGNSSVKVGDDIKIDANESGKSSVKVGGVNISY